MSLMKTSTTLIIFCIFIATLAYAKTAEDYFYSGVKKGESADYKGAIQDFNKVIELNPNSAAVYYGRGLVKLIIMQKESGCLDLSKAGELGYAEAYESIKKHCN